MLRWCTLVLGLALTCVPSPAQSARVKALATGKVLVAGRDLPDPNFAETVILLIDYSKDGAMGLTLNRRSRLPLSRVLQMQEAKGRTDPLFIGGPVGRSGVLALLRSRTKPEETRHVSGDIYVISSSGLLRKKLAAGTAATALRVYAGYSGWGRGQLEREVELGAWHVFPGDARTVFDPDPGSLWRRLIELTELRIAAIPSPHR